MISGGTAETVQVRPITHEDAASVAELSRQLGYEAGTAEIAARIDRLLTNDEQVGLVACLNIEVVGWIEAAIARHLQSPAHTLIGGLVVKDGLRGQGVGKRLCAAIEQWSRTKGIHIARVTSRSTREAARRFYLREGYLQTKTSLVFEKTLPKEPALPAFTVDI